MKNSIIKSAITWLLLLSPSTFAATDIIGGEMEFKGVVAHGCTIVAGDENTVVDFKQISALLNKSESANRMPPAATPVMRF